ncbi:MAG: isoprenylcysteine carboxylmethyltransferase family protein [Rhizobiaceae bacterium]|jgi:protein-S-isoprenylcysteine O-methyltransferase Ste14|nr:isoprenylcysteine carboxylmethyltransferase family protein [Rhizobiaceae bacterium]
MNIPPIAQLAIFACLAVILATFLPGLTVDVPIWLPVLVGLIGVLFLLPAVVSFAKQKTTVDPRTPEAATTLVTSGIYGITRNPMYVGMLLLLLALAAWLAAASSLLPTIAFLLSIDRGQIRREEESLRQNFGVAFETYANRVPRWLFF